MEWIGLVVIVLALAWWVAQGETGPGSRGRRAVRAESSSVSAAHGPAAGPQARSTADDGPRPIASEPRSAGVGQGPARAFGSGPSGARPQPAGDPDTGQTAPSDFASVARESGWFVDPVPQWLVDAAEEWLAGNKTSVVPLRNTGEPLNKEEKRALGVNVNAKLGRDYVNALSDAGRAECPLRALETCLERARSRRAQKGGSP